MLILGSVADVFDFFFNRSGSVIVDFLIFTSPDFTGTITNLRNALIGKVNNSYLGPYNVTTEKIAGKKTWEISGILIRVLLKLIIHYYQSLYFTAGTFQPKATKPSILREHRHANFGNRFATVVNNKQICLYLSLLVSRLNLGDDLVRCPCVANIANEPNRMKSFFFGHSDRIVIEEI